MHTPSFFCAGQTPAIRYAKEHLIRQGFSVKETPSWDTQHILLDVPSFRPGQEQYITTLISSLPGAITIWGGNLQHPILEGFHTRDLLQDESYLMKNAGITAECTLDIIAPLLKQPWENTRILITGWGRIGKHLAPLLREKGCCVHVSARKESDLAEISSLGYEPLETGSLQPLLTQMNLIINTVPAMILPDTPANVPKIDLASKPGIRGDHVLRARGLPGIYAPEQSGKLIAETILRLLKEECK